MQINPFSSLTPELVVWEDISECDETWADESDIQHWLNDSSDAYVEQLGFVIAEDDKNLIFANSYIESMELFGNVHKIPKSIIISRTKLISQN